MMTTHAPNYLPLLLRRVSCRITRSVVVRQSVDKAAPLQYHAPRQTRGHRRRGNNGVATLTSHHRYSIVCAAQGKGNFSSSPDGRDDDDASIASSAGTRNEGGTGGFGEQSQPTTVLRVCIPVTPAQLPAPGVQLCLPVSRNLMEQLDRGDGKVVLAVLEDDANDGFRVRESHTGSYACEAELLSSPELLAGVSFVATFRALRRVAVRHLRVNMDGFAVCNAAELTDRWVYFVRYSSVEALAAAPEWTNVPEEDDGSERQVKHALRDILEASAELKAAVGDLAELTGKVATRSGEGGQNEWAELLQWAESQSSQESAAASLQRLHEGQILSFGAFQETAYTPDGVLPALRQRAMEVTDLGMRIEDAVVYTADLRRTMRAALAIDDSFGR